MAGDVELALEVQRAALATMLGAVIIDYTVTADYITIWFSGKGRRYIKVHQTLTPEIGEVQYSARTH